MPNYGSGLYGRNIYGGDLIVKTGGGISAVIGSSQYGVIELERIGGAIVGSVAGVIKFWTVQKTGGGISELTTGGNLKLAFLSGNRRWLIDATADIPSLSIATEDATEIEIIKLNNPQLLKTRIR